MSHASLATRHRPQAFSEVTGQSMIKTILSRAAARDNVAPAYLFSGTRGVGKTTLARIFAKALNCINAPTGEPCNVCDQCKRITMGNHVDVVEIDGASNTGVDDARRLKETIGYAPMEGRYKVFIIDEAHMLSRNAFNALLKTLEEPPPRAIFIMATTEPHKFPATIISRCQHFVFQAQPERELVEHLRQILEKEGVRYEMSALRLIARRAAGSVRDSMSLMGQTLALGGDSLDEAITRDVLGVAGQEAYERLLEAIRNEDCPAVVVLVRELLERGIDIGFFLRELTTLWRNLFLIRQSGQAGAALALDLPEDEQQRLADLAPEFSLTFIHAAWQMVLESQRQVLTSLEPAASLELLLLNMALLPRLVSLETLSAVERNSAPGDRPVSRSERAPEGGSENRAAASSVAPPAPPVAAGAPLPEPEPQPVSHAFPQQGRRTHDGAGDGWNGPDAAAPEAAMRPAARSSRAAGPLEPSEEAIVPSEQAVPLDAAYAPPAGSPAPPSPEAAGSDAVAAAARGDLAWGEFLDFCADHPALCGPVNVPQLRQAKGRFEGDMLSLVTVAAMQQNQFSAPAYLQGLHRLAEAYAGRPIAVQVLPPAQPVRTEADIKAEMNTRPQVQAVVQTFDAQLIRCIQDERPDGGESE